ncbi:hypothetical protein [Dapis sp. BLCC M229]|uniref:hypothetical protein n=1 Tax=Dapis sp. BLCC M229 TaxID=3400188 RepID=UPI003CF77206
MSNNNKKSRQLLKFISVTIASLTAITGFLAAIVSLNNSLNSEIKPTSVKGVASKLNKEVSQNTNTFNNKNVNTNNSSAQGGSSTNNIEGGNSQVGDFNIENNLNFENFSRDLPVNETNTVNIESSGDGAIINNNTENTKSQVNIHKK